MNESNNLANAIRENMHRVRETNLALSELWLNSGFMEKSDRDLIGLVIRLLDDIQSGTYQAIIQYKRTNNLKSRW